MPATLYGAQQIIQQQKILRLIAAAGRPVIPNDEAMRQACRELVLLGLLWHHGFLLIDESDCVHFAYAYSISREGLAVLKGGK